ncbi:MAG TPA: lipid-A-disaccharide synthase [Candidatus Kapabacteria bacterium]|nr:lipid-A-disaccharide synthase [Candidatus Kapabacteria bacterium]
MHTKSILLIAGEASGDRIASRAIRAAKMLADERGENISFFGIAGDECAAEGAECLHSAREMSVVGFVEVARRFAFFRRVFREMVRALEERRPDAVLLIDYPGFNIRFAREAKRRGVRVIYYVSPQVWAWHRSRIYELKKVVDEMLVIFPFEEKLYRDAGLKNAHFIGHPLVERIEEEQAAYQSREAFAVRHNLATQKEWLLVFPGSRSEEVRRLLPVMSQAAAKFSAVHNMQPILVESASMEASYYDEYRRASIIRFRNSEATHELMFHAQLGVLKSGTTTLEAALLGLPGIICYRTHPLSFAIGKRVVKLPYIGLANIVLGKKLYPELLQNDVTVNKILDELNKVDGTRLEFQKSLQGLAETLRGPAPGPSRRVAEILLAA